MGHVLVTMICCGPCNMPTQARSTPSDVVINEENILTVVAVLNNGGRLIRNDESGHSRDAHNRPIAGR